MIKIQGHLLLLIFLLGDSKILNFFQLHVK